jgi:hypothetical protein
VFGESSARSTSSGRSKFFPPFLTYLCKEFVCAEIPLFKINNLELENFHLKCIKADHPGDSCVPKCCEETLNKFEYCAGKNVFGYP